MNEYIEKIDAYIAPLADVPGLRLARVGGSVRDELLGRRAKDADYVAFGKTLDELGRALRLTFPNAKLSPLKLRDGRQAGWRLFEKGYGLIEIMLPRTDVSTGPGHRDFKIILNPDLTAADDAQRRDFTFNALYKWINRKDLTVVEVLNKPYAVLTNVEDPTGRGLYDLQHKLVSTTYSNSFAEDPLRTLRALRFVSTLGYDLSTAAYNQMREHASSVGGMNYKDNTSGTVLDEMNKLLMGDDVAKALRLMRDTGVMAAMLPELADMLGYEQGSRYHDLTTDEHTFTAMHAAARANAPLRVRWALLFHDAGKPAVAWTGDDGRKHYYRRTEEAHKNSQETLSGNEPVNLDHEEYGEYLWRQFAKRANVPKDLREDVATLIRNHMVALQPRNAGVKVRRWRVQYGDELLSDLLLHRACDCAGKKASAAPQIKLVYKLRAAQEEAINAGVPASVKDLQFTGGDLVTRFQVKGKVIGEVMRDVLDEVVCDPTDQKLTFEWQIDAAGRHLSHKKA